MKSDGRTVRTTVHTVRAYDYEYDDCELAETERLHRGLPLLGSKSSQLLHGRDFLF